MKRDIIIVLLMALYIPVAVIAQESDPMSTEKLNFTWGAEMGGGIDMSENDMSTIDFNACLGMRFSVVRMLGIGAGANMMVSNSCRSFPVFALFRSSFSKVKKLCFLDIRGGVSINYMPDDYQQTGLYLSGGVGINLASSKNFSSHIIIGYSFFSRDDYVIGDFSHRLKDLHFANLRLGVSF